MDRARRCSRKEDIDYWYLSMLVALRLLHTLILYTAEPFLYCNSNMNDMIMNTQMFWCDQKVRGDQALDCHYILFFSVIHRATGAPLRWL